MSHPAVAPVMERSAIVGGADGAACILGAKLAGKRTGRYYSSCRNYHYRGYSGSGAGFSEIIPPHYSRVILVDTFKDEAEESLRVARALGENLEGVRLDTPEERGGVTPGLVEEVRVRLDQAGFLR